MRRRFLVRRPVDGFAGRYRPPQRSGQDCWLALLQGYLPLAKQILLVSGGAALRLRKRRCAGIPILGRCPRREPRVKLAASWLDDGWLLARPRFVSIRRVSLHPRRKRNANPAA